MQLFGKFGKIMCWRPLGSAPEIYGLYECDGPSILVVIYSFRGTNVVGVFKLVILSSPVQIYAFWYTYTNIINLSTVTLDCPLLMKGKCF